VSEWSGIMCQESSDEQSGWLGIRIMCQSGAMSEVRLAGIQDNVSGWESG
jgi:hypothetical protein